MNSLLIWHLRFSLILKFRAFLIQETVSALHLVFSGILSIYLLMDVPRNDNETRFTLEDIFPDS